MSTTFSERSSANRSWSSARHISEKSYDFRILVSIAASLNKDLSANFDVLNDTGIG
jgi:hypothetical protein